MKYAKNSRVLWLYVWFEEGKYININQVAIEFGVTVRTVQRDIADIRAFLAELQLERGEQKKIVYDRRIKKYLLKDCFIASQQAL